LKQQSPFKWRHFEPSLILLCVRWCCRYQLSYRDVEEHLRSKIIFATQPKLVPDLATIRRLYAEEICIKAALRSEALVAALAKVPREHYLGAGPWLIKKDGRGLLHAFWQRLRGEYRMTADADPRQIYRDVHVAIDPERGLNNGRPSKLALWLDSLELQAGERVLHVGCGVGYYTAVMAEVVGPRGRVVGVEVDGGLAQRAARNLAHLAQVEVVHADGGSHDARPCDAIFVNAGSARLRPVWLDSLRPGGRLLLPLTNDAGRGVMLKVIKEGRGLAARFISSARIYHCAGGREAGASRRLASAFKLRGWAEVRSVRRDAHTRDAACWLHEEGCCLSTMPVPSGS
jgi:protein-L-isoaspartate(D-aspartate) O-methyltransferase